MPGQLHELSVAIGALQADVRTLTGTVRTIQTTSTEEHRKVHDIVVATSEAVRNLARDVAEMKPLTDDYREQRAERRGAYRLAKYLYATGGGIAAVAIEKLTGVIPFHFLRIFILIGVGLLAFSAHATWKPAYGAEPQAVQQWFKSAMIPGGGAYVACRDQLHDAEDFDHDRTCAEKLAPAVLRLHIVMCCEQAERLMTKFVATSADSWAYYPDPACDHDGCRVLPIPADVVHADEIHALNPADDKLPQFNEMRRQGVLFIYGGKPSCFWPPEGGI